MLIQKRKIILSMIMVLLLLTACRQNKENVIEESSLVGNLEQIEEVGIDENGEGVEQEVNTMDGWVGYFAHAGSSPGTGRITMNLFIYPEYESYFGYFNLSGYEKKEGMETFSDAEERMLVEIKGNQDLIDVYFGESFAEESERGEMFGNYQKGDLLFSLKREDDEIVTIWENMLLDEDEEDRRRGFVKRDEFLSIKFADENDKNNFLKAKDISEDDEPFFQYYNEKGDLQLDLYYDKVQQAGIGIFYDEYKGKETICGFEVGDLYTASWNHDEFSVTNDDRDVSNLEEYEEETIYNDRGQLTYFRSMGIIPEMEDSVRQRIEEMELTYREDGSLEKREFYYNSWQFGTSRSSGTCYYDEQERLKYVDSYITHGYLEDYYIYENDNEVPSYCLTVDHMGYDAWELGFTKYVQ